MAAGGEQEEKSQVGRGQRWAELLTLAFFIWEPKKNFAELHTQKLLLSCGVCVFRERASAPLLPNFLSSRFFSRVTLQATQEEREEEGNQSVRAAAPQQLLHRTISDRLVS